jgi:uncharacterized surface protein with fasciclin (FAS1) repeats
MKNIIETAIATPQLSTLVAAIKRANLVETLSGTGPFTVFAPTNEAFAKIPAATLEAVLADHRKLTSTLTYHVIPGKVMSKDITSLKEAKTVQGNMVAIDTSNGVMVDDATVITADIECSNGVVHMIDTVLMPK